MGLRSRYGATKGRRQGHKARRHPFFALGPPWWWVSRVSEVEYGACSWKLKEVFCLSLSYIVSKGFDRPNKWHSTIRIPDHFEPAGATSSAEREES